MCNLEKIFPPAFFDSMEHLIVHLSYEARIGNPVQYRWMYPFERFLCELKKNVKNKTHIEASLVETYIWKKSASSYYFELNVLCKQIKLSRNDNLTSNEDRTERSNFNHLG
ncbi:UNVERIFIED_CONTAM: hypothetical protein Sradi_4117500 [Sesamum radiatum]|uniref:DUF4218 domain-containing protein n=1 Tax=Sesamum radiatum TaxID=300843 RepID=A0AAW2P2K5_SESRA